MYFKGNKLYIHLTFINTSTSHIFPYACQKTFKIGNEKEIYIQTMIIFLHKLKDGVHKSTTDLQEPALSTSYGFILLSK